jgi:hypothetical protein
MQFFLYSLFRQPWAQVGQDAPAQCAGASQNY